MPYLSAVVKETFRFHQPLGFLLEQVVPDRGLQLPDGPFLPSGNSWRQRMSCTPQSSI
ncbi:uncharacterized protein CLUP02_17862 [Colletotrichum lupini]|uniref:Uncharacterized protein n=1 Tax=Colletotrichum lupini TaxID=145971 RepID=A0A9Q8SFI5_9PEZI|nr:uncharacterized protein CLUP02_17862 [Colletotrichum lupini]UQC76349.1 hypothetical protein CLUP02_17862 [Colletotrichum lupini]